MLGKGAYAIVRLATHKKTKAIVAIKTYEKIKLFDCLHFSFHLIIIFCEVTVKHPVVHIRKIGVKTISITKTAQCEIDEPGENGIY